MTFVRTVLGDIAPAALGITNYHEHLFQVSPLLPGDELDDEARSQAEAALLRGAGTRSMVEATPTGLGRDAAATARISAFTGLHIVATTGRHREPHYAAGHWTHDATEGELAAQFITDLAEGCPLSDEPAGPFGGSAHTFQRALSPHGQPVRAGLLKAGIGYWSISAFERRTLEAVGAAHRATGAPVMVHLEFCTAAHEVLDLLERLGVTADRIILAHADRNPDSGLHLELTARGAYLGYDGMARPKGQTDAQIIGLVADMCVAGAADRLLLGGDVGRSTRYVSYGGIPGITYLSTRFLPRLARAVGEDAVARLTTENPARILAWALIPALG